jgi:hypothetical protein
MIISNHTKNINIKNVNEKYNILKIITLINNCRFIQIQFANFKLLGFFCYIFHSLMRSFFMLSFSCFHFFVLPFFRFNFSISDVVSLVIMGQHFFNKSPPPL